MSSAELSLSDRKSFTAHLDTVFHMMEQRVKSTLDKVDFMWTIADVWTAHNKIFFGMTVYWIDPSTLQRCKAAISCSNFFPVCHTYDAFSF